MGILSVENVTFTYPLTSTPAVDHVSFALQNGEFAVLCGATGSGKSTLLRLLKRELTPKGTLTGTIRVDEADLTAMDARASAQTIGFVMQHPEHQLVTDTVWHELAFGLENLGVPSETIARRIAEIAAYFGIEEHFERPVCELSGGQKQLVCLAAVMVMDPQILILDEPTSQMDPIAASAFLATLKKINRELSVTVLITEHRTEEVIPEADRLILIDNGRIVADGHPSHVASSLKKGSPLACLMPTAVRLYHELDGQGPAPLSVSEAARFIRQNYDRRVPTLSRSAGVDRSSTALRWHRVRFRYDRYAPDVLRELSMSVYEGECCCILGGNGAGKSTALAVASGLLAPYGGYVEVFGQKMKAYRNHSLYRECLTMLPQDVQTVFLKNTVKEELTDGNVDEATFPFDFSPFYDRHPYDLSGGQQQLLALAKVLGCRPRLLLLDEPTKGLDAVCKHTLIDVIQRLKANGLTVVCVTHDVEFAALLADRCVLMFRGQAVCTEETARFFEGNRFYTTAAHRMTKGYYDGVVTSEDAVTMCRLNDRKRDGDSS